MVDDKIQTTIMRLITSQNAIHIVLPYEEKHP